MVTIRGCVGVGLLVAACSSEGSAAPVEGETGSTAASDPGSAGDDSTMREETTGADSSSEQPGTETSGGASFPGCGGMAALEGVTTGTITVAGVPRSFVVSMPDGYDPDEPTALVFAFHGRGGTAELFRSYSGLEAAAGDAAVFVYPQGLPLASMGGQTGWELTQSGYDVVFVTQLLDELTANLCIDPARVYATGHSFGGYFSNTLGCALSDRLRAIGPVASGGPFGGCPDPMAAIVIHGIDDLVVPTSAGEATRDHWRANNGCGADAEPTDVDTCVAYQGCDAGYDVIWCLHEESPPGIGTHTWPSFAAPAIWSFFVAHGA